MKTILIFNRQISLSNFIGPTLRSFYGISFMAANSICIRFGLRYNSKFSDLSNSDTFYLSEIVSKFFPPDYQIIRSTVDNINYKIRNGSYQGFCLINGLPSRGQRSKTNGKTAIRKLPLTFTQSIR
jgi:small subunit ribosomal protein S13